MSVDPALVECIRKDTGSLQLEGKVCTLLRHFGAPDILIAGDSRAERQLVPSVIEQRLGSTALNVAVIAGDPLTLHKALVKHPALSARLKLIVLSVGVYQINEPLVSHDYMSLAAFADLTDQERSVLFARDTSALQRQIGLCGDWCSRPTLQCREHDNILQRLVRSRGFMGVEGVWMRDVSGWARKHATWYGEPRLDGIRCRHFLAALDSLACWVPKLLLVQAPVSPSWRAATRWTHIGRTERRFTQVLRAKAAETSGTAFIDMYGPTDLGLTDLFFYDAFHLNSLGAVVYTAMLCDSMLAHGMVAVHE